MQSAYFDKNAAASSAGSGGNARYWRGVCIAAKSYESKGYDIPERRHCAPCDTFPSQSVKDEPDASLKEFCAVVVYFVFLCCIPRGYR